MTLDRGGICCGCINGVDIQQEGEIAESEIQKRKRKERLKQLKDGLFFRVEARVMREIFGEGEVQSDAVVAWMSYDCESNPRMLRAITERVVSEYLTENRHITEAGVFASTEEEERAQREIFDRVKRSIQEECPHLLVRR